LSASERLRRGGASTALLNAAMRASRMTSESPARSGRSARIVGDSGKAVAAVARISLKSSAALHGPSVLHQAYREPACRKCEQDLRRAFATRTMMSPRAAERPSGLPESPDDLPDGSRLAAGGVVHSGGFEKRTPGPESDYDRLYAPLFSYSARMRSIRTRIEILADTDVTVLIRGESGVGKEIAARAIHLVSERRGGPFIRINCAALPAELLESELFGHEKGAFTGAYRTKPGKFELAAKGTLFLDEIGDLPLPLQAKLLHVLQDGEFIRVGGTEHLHADVRVITATNRPLEQALAAGRFREDLYYRLNVVTIRIPPLRERPEEIPTLVAAFLARFNEQYGRQARLTEESLHLLASYSWPGNVRELENTIKRLVVLNDEAVVGDELRELIDAAVAASPDATGPPSSSPEPTLREAARRAAVEAERRIIESMLDRVRWNRAEAARLLGISYKSLLYKMDRCGLQRKRRSA
jgi:transcriptional regulator with GAF, ATPase, and Fis domain